MWERDILFSIIAVSSACGQMGATMSYSFTALQLNCTIRSTDGVTYSMVQLMVQLLIFFCQTGRFYWNATYYALYTGWSRINRTNFNAL